ncbi:hypothetical protein J4G33_09010 [Actinotalea sp. BY-33]|uniref:Uncharacterized protein n=1 Tax=Actinotalea soli TaxID=2819234 RepID=A0A939LPE4_9CELL|nr:hypothetical protein [Actinotalea soli]MBO1751941.1 hypothetical protein [Actinotalea soli]
MSLLHEVVVHTGVGVLALSPAEPELREGLNPEAVTPGLLGFLVIFLAVLVCIPLFLSMTGKLRRVEHRRRREDTEEGAGSEPDQPGSPDAARAPGASSPSSTPSDGRPPGASGPTED